MKRIYFEDQDKTYNQHGDLMIGASERNYLDRINKKTCNLLEEKDMNYLKIIVEKETHIIDLEAELEKYKKIVEAARIAMTNFHPLKESPFNALNDALKKRSRDD